MEGQNLPFFIINTSLIMSPWPALVSFLVLLHLISIGAAQRGEGEPGEGQQGKFAPGTS